MTSTCHMGGLNTEAHAFIKTEQNLTTWQALPAKCLKAVHKWLYVAKFTKNIRLAFSK